jgi:hypothetical protein
MCNKSFTQKSSVLDYLIGKDHPIESWNFIANHKYMVLVPHRASIVHTLNIAPNGKYSSARWFTRR